MWIQLAVHRRCHWLCRYDHSTPGLLTVSSVTSTVWVHPGREAAGVELDSITTTVVVVVVVLVDFSYIQRIVVFVVVVLFPKDLGPKGTRAFFGGFPAFFLLR